MWGAWPPWSCHSGTQSRHRQRPQGDALVSSSGQSSPDLPVPAFRGFRESSAIKSFSGSKSFPVRPQSSQNRNSHPCHALVWIPDPQNPWAEECTCLKPLHLGVISYIARVTETESKERFKPMAMRLRVWEARMPWHVIPELTLLITDSSASKWLWPCMSKERMKESSG